VTWLFMCRVMLIEKHSLLGVVVFAFIFGIRSIVVLILPISIGVMLMLMVLGSLLCFV